MLPVEMTATRKDQSYWLENMLGPHQFSNAEAAQVLGRSEAEISADAQKIKATPASGLLVRPYPGGRPIRIGFREGAIDPLRGTKASVFLPWSPRQYVVIDLPEAIFSNVGLLFLAHTHVPTIWNDQNKVIENVDWERKTDGGLRSSWRLPNGMKFRRSDNAGRRSGAHGTDITQQHRPDAESPPNSDLRVAEGGSRFSRAVRCEQGLWQDDRGVRSADRSRWILTEWERCGRTWGNAQCPCLHSDPVLPDCAPGQMVRVTGRLWFAEGEQPGIV